MAGGAKTQTRNTTGRSVPDSPPLTGTGVPQGAAALPALSNARPIAGFEIKRIRASPAHLRLWAINSAMACDPALRPSMATEALFSSSKSRTL